MENVKTASWGGRLVAHLMKKLTNLWILWNIQPMGTILNPIIFGQDLDAGTSYKYGAYLADKLDTTTLAAFTVFQAQVETATGHKIRRIQSDGEFDTTAWREYCQPLGIKHEFSTPYSSSQNGLAERAIQTTIEDVCTLLSDSGLLVTPIGLKQQHTPSTPEISSI